jgi:predicted dehydrogenase
MWDVHRNLMNSMSPIVDCGVHYVDVMCQMTRSKPIRVSGLGARLTEDLPEGKINYGHLQVTFEDGSIGWYEAGWGPMMSETAFFVKDVVGPKGCVTISAKTAGGEGASAEVDAHTKTEALRLHHSELDANNQFVKEDDWIDMEDEPDHDELCHREQAYLLRAIRENVDLTDHMGDALSSMRIVEAADESFRTGRTVDL